MSFKIIFLAALLLPVHTMAENLVSVAARQANVRNGPGGEYEVVWTAAIYYPVEIVDSDGNWLKISDYENDEGWIHKSVVSGAPTVVVTSQKANVREGPGMEYESVWELDQAYSLKLLKVERGWLKVSDGNEVSGWIHNSVVWGFTEPRQLEQLPAY